MTVIVASDLDQTLIYSRRACEAAGVDPSGAQCVEIYQDAPASFMTKRGADALTELAASATFVPVTTRIPEQFARVQLPPTRYAIVSNGGQLLVDGAPDPAWSGHVAAVLRGCFPLHEVWEQFAHVCWPEFTEKLRNAEDLFCYAVVRPSLLPAGFVADLTGWAAERGWRVSLQGRKLYCVPDALTKSAAVAELARRVEAGTVLAAGDSLLDVDLLLAADRAIHPRHGELFEQGWSAPHVEQTRASGPIAGEQIAQWFVTNGIRATG